MIDQSETSPKPFQALHDHCGAAGIGLLGSALTVFFYLLILAIAPLRAQFVREGDVSFLGVCLGAVLATALALWVIDQCLAGNKGRISFAGSAFAIFGGLFLMGFLLGAYIVASWPGVLFGALSVAVAAALFKVAWVTSEQPAAVAQGLPQNLPPEGQQLLATLLQDLAPPAESRFGALFKSHVQQEREMLERVAIEKAKTQYAYYVSQQIRWRMQGLGFALDIEEIQPVVIEYLFGGKASPEDNDANLDVFW